jgi:hypothetical protein
MEFTIHSPLSIDDCENRLMTGVEGPLGSIKPYGHGWHVLGNGSGESFQATIVGVGIAPNGRRIIATQPSLSVSMTRSGEGTQVAGQISSRYPTKRQILLSRYVLPAELVVFAILAVMSPSGRPFFIAAIVLSAGLLLAARVSRRALRPSEEASQRELLAWLRKAVEATADAVAKVD